MKLAHSIGIVKHPNYNTREQILACNEPIGFDGIYKNVYDNQDVLQGKSGIFFVMGNYVGMDNSFEYPIHVPQIEQYCTWSEIREMTEKYNFVLGWHTWSHPDLTKIPRSEIVKEVTPPFPMDFFAYPYGRYNQTVVDCVKQAGFTKAWSVTQGSTNLSEQDYDFKIFRDYIKN